MTVEEGVDITKAQDGGVLKRIIKEGKGTETPNVGCQVIVHYTGTLLDGTKFDSSKDRNEPFEFQLGKDMVIKGWEEGVATMKMGEVAMLICQPEYAYGEQGNPPKIPPNETLQFEIEVLDWKLEDLSPNKNKGILRYVVEQGTGRDCPNDGSAVTVELEGKLTDGTVFDNRTVSFVLGEGAEINICHGLERAIEKFNLSEKSILTIQPKYAFMSEGNSEMGVPPNAVVEYTVKLVSFEKAKEPWAMSADERVQQAKICKEKGTNYFKDNKYQMAIKKYKKVCTLLEDMVDDITQMSEYRNAGKRLLLAVHLNLALVYLKVSAFYPANDHANKALKFDPKNVKGLFRRGQALLAIEEAEKALQDFEKVVQAEPENKAAANQIKVCRSVIARQKQKEKLLYANMFDKFAKHDSEVERLRAKAAADAYSGPVGEWAGEDGDGRFQNM
ncbi:hypothetical protein KGM_210582 [Danaus plexippus plexippus]|uniref:peptidylprolyl isomerase n=1 Tax=Danaus plexippus plexippus TaxID=278856 RepID=A0A212EQB0_DANPL|nr:hypothetical protein KGM_210582 [Danaus plexippus plexippus]